MRLDKKNYVVTGGCGFIGSHVIDELLKRDDINKIFVIDKLGMGSDIYNVASDPDDLIRFIFDDIACDRAYEELPGIDYILHLAAESHVDRSITDPLACVTSNVMGTAKLLELARTDKARMVHVSTDEVYGHLQLDEPAFTEDTALAPRSPYSATKAGSDLLVQSYCTTFKINASITRCCNNYGPRQACEKLIPTVIGKLLKDEPIPIYGNGQNMVSYLKMSLVQSMVMVRTFVSGFMSLIMLRQSSKYFILALLILYTTFQVAAMKYFILALLILSITFQVAAI
jgi:dTDP-glucose 4,6-dehydratase